MSSKDAVGTTAGWLRNNKQKDGILPEDPSDEWEVWSDGKTWVKDQTISVVVQW